jgi:hypothetical protein
LISESVKKVDKQPINKNIGHAAYQLKIVRMIGVEPTWITPPDPKSGASANFATSGFGVQK